MLSYENLNELLGQLNIFSPFSEILIEFSFIPWLYLFFFPEVLFVYFLFSYYTRNISNISQMSDNPALSIHV